MDHANTQHQLAPVQPYSRLKGVNLCGFLQFQNAHRGSYFFLYLTFFIFSVDSLTNPVSFRYDLILIYVLVRFLQGGGTGERSVALSSITVASIFLL